MDGTCRAFRHTLLAELALGEINVSHIVLYSDSIESTHLCTLAASYAGSLAGLARYGTLVLVYA